MSKNTEVLCGLGPWRPSFLQPLASKKVYLFFYGCLGIIQGMFFTYLRLIELIRLKLPNIKHMNDHRGQIVGQFRIYQRMDQSWNRLKILHSGSKCQKVWIEKSAKLTPFDFAIPTQLEKIKVRICFINISKVFFFQKILLIGQMTDVSLYLKLLPITSINIGLALV